MPDNVEVSEDGKSSKYHYGRHTNPTLDKLIDSAIERMKDQPEPLKAAAVLLQRWFEAGTLPADVLPDLFQDLEGRVAARAEIATNSASQQ